VLEPANGSMDKFVTWSDNPGLVLRHLGATGLPEGKLAQQYTICGNFFHSAYGALSTIIISSLPLLRRTCSFARDSKSERRSTWRNPTSI